MAVTSTILNTALVIEVSNGLDNNGNKKWKKLTFQGVKQEAPLQNIYDVAVEFNIALGLEARGFHLTQNVGLTNQS